MRFTSVVSFAVLALLGQANASLPMPRSQAPSFTNLNAVDPSQEFTKLSLSDYKGKYVVLVFYPFDFTYVCPTELISFSENLKRF